MKQISPAALREAAPTAIGRLAELVVDNPIQVGLIMAGGITLTAAARNLVRPRSLAEAVALAVVVEAVAVFGTAALVERGLIPIKVRDHASSEASPV